LIRENETIAQPIFNFPCKNNAAAGGILVALRVLASERGWIRMAEEHEARQPYKCAVCGEKFDSQEQLQEHLKKCTAKTN
jgi:hypothetical protein